MGDFHGPMTELYDVFVDWPGRLQRERPGLLAHLERVAARRVLDVGCGTGHHVRALLDAGLDAHGADPSPDMLTRARSVIGDAKRLHAWGLGDDPPRSLEALAPFDAIVSLGNVWPQLTRRGDVDRALASIRSLLRPEGLLLLAFKVLAPRAEAGRAYLPLLRRVHRGETLLFARIYDFAAPPVEPTDPGARVCGFHVAILSGEACPEGEGRARHQRGGMVRIWSQAELHEAFHRAGFVDVELRAGWGAAEASPTTEDVVLVARPSSSV